MKLRTLILLVAIWTSGTCLLVAQPVANFSISTSSGCNPLTNVQFTNTTTGSGSITYVWKKNGVQFSTLQNPSASFSSPGVYVIQLTATNGSGSNSLSKNVTVWSNPVSNFSATSALAGCIPLTVQFQDASTATGTSIASRLWSFGDGGQSGLANPNHTYTLSGNFPVSLKVTDGHGCEDTKQIPNYITVYPLPNPQFSSNSVRITCAPPLTVVFINSSSGSGTLTYAWDFGDGNSATTATPSHTYQGYGIYDVKLTVTDANGCTKSITLNDYVRIQAISADFSTSADSICIGDSVIFSDNSTGALTRNWDFDDGFTGTGIQAIHTFNDSGWFNVRMIASVPSAGCADTAYKQVYVQQVIANYSVSDPYICQYPGKAVVYFENSINGDYHTWLHGYYCPNVPMSIPCGIPIGHDTVNYNDFYKQAEGIWADTLISWSKLGCYDTLVKDTSVEINFARAGAILSKTQGCRPYPINFAGIATPFNPSVSTPSPPITITNTVWKIEDTLYSTALNPPGITVTDTGGWSGYFIVENSLGCIDSVKFNYEAGDSVKADFVMLEDSVCVGEITKAISLSQDTNYINSYTWGGDFNQSIVGRDVFVSSDQIGWVSIQHVVQHRGCSDTIINPNAFYAKGPTTSISYGLFNCIDSTKIYFYANIKQAARWYWDFGHPSIPIDSVNTSTTIVYPTTGGYLVTLTSYNADTSCEYVETISVQVGKLKAKIRGSTKVPVDSSFTSLKDINNDTIRVCAPASLGFSSMTSGGVYGDWNIGSTVLSNIPRDSVFYLNFNTKGFYNIRLVIFDTVAGCSDTAHSVIAVYSPEADFIGNPSVGCTPLSVQINPVVNTLNKITKYYWNVGGQIDSSQVFSKTYPTDVDLNVQLTVIDTFGCQDVVTKKNFIKSSTFDIYLVATSIRQICTGDTIGFIQSIPVSNVAYKWYFGDGDSASGPNPTHVYLDSGLFDVKLVAHDSVGCVRTQIRADYIEVQLTPDADFWADRTDSTCYPLPVQFTADTGIVYYNDNDYLYTLGDFSAASNYKDPFYNYVRPGKYTVSLKVTSSFGCKDIETKVDYINVGGPYGELDFHPDSICRGDTVFFTLGNPINANDYGWDFGDGVVVENTSPVSHIYRDSVGYFYPSLYFADTAGGCPKTFEDTVYVFETVANMDFIDTMGCVSFDPQLVNTSTMANWWRWDFGDGAVAVVRDPIKVYRAPGTYVIELRVRNAIGCADTLIQTFHVYPRPVAEAQKDTLICEGDTTQLFAAGGSEYYWIPSNSGIMDTLIKNPFASPKYSIEYHVQVTDTNGCQDTAQVIVLVQNPIILDLTDPLIMIVGEKLNLVKGQDPAGGIYKWEPSIGLDCDTCPSPTLTALESGTYTVTVTDTNGCFESVSTFYLEVRNEYTLDVPTAFTPNGDGVNDVIYADGWGILDLISFTIYNRWGQMVFESTELEIGWDGTYNGQPMEMDTYVYYVEGLTYGNTILRKKGEFTLMR